MPFGCGEAKLSKKLRMDLCNRIGMPEIKGSLKGCVNGAVTRFAQGYEIFERMIRRFVVLAKPVHVMHNSGRMVPALAARSLVALKCLPAIPVKFVVVPLGAGHAVSFHLLKRERVALLPLSALLDALGFGAGRAANLYAVLVGKCGAAVNALLDRSSGGHSASNPQCLKAGAVSGPTHDIAAPEAYGLSAAVRLELRPTLSARLFDVANACRALLLHRARLASDAVAGAFRKELVAVLAYCRSVNAHVISLSQMMSHSITARRIYG